MQDGTYASPMHSTRMRVVLCVIALLTISSIPIQAQEVPAPAGWEMGFVYENGASEDDPFPLEEEETTIRFWIRNDNLIGDIEISLEYSMVGLVPQQLTLSGEESVTVGSGSNDTFTLKIAGIDVWDIASGLIFELEIDGEMTAFQGVPLAVPMSSQSIDGELIVPELFRWEVDIEEVEHRITAGSEFNLHLDLVNKGNTPDSISGFSVEDDCPVLTSDDEPLNSVLGQVTYPEYIWYTDGSVGSYDLFYEPTSVTLVFDASSTHPTRMCEIEITVQSTSVNNGGDGDASNKGEIDVEIEARPVGAQQDQDDASTDDDDGPQNQDQVTSDNFLMFPTLVTPMAILWAALMRAREE
ncbi:MAG: hypothetical protein OSB32_04005 [Candidatus Poseidoniales archaeon]|nr:hypothetical protein [Candidatus Poseidoniales archaeon]